MTSLILSMQNKNLGLQSDFIHNNTAITTYWATDPQTKLQTPKPFNAKVTAVSPEETVLASMINAFFLNFISLVNIVDWTIVSDPRIKFMDKTHIILVSTGS